MKSIITKNGFNIMNQNRADGSVQYWIGYYGLAYIPEEDRTLDENTTELVEGNKGDVIYNLFQGGMTPVGFDTDSGENSSAARLLNECMYTSSIINKFRYVLDGDDNNQLLVFADYQPSNEDFGLKQYAKFGGVGTSSDDLNPDNKDTSVSDLPIPAPLYYLGEPVDYTTAQDITDMPTVSCDTRVYRASKDALTGDVNADQTVLSRASIYDWFDSEDNVYTKDDSNKAEFYTLDQYWKYQSVSNFNRFHAQANVSGYAVDYEPACRNLSKATRFFPISHYDVIDTKDDVTVSQVKYTISIDLDNVFSKVSQRTTAYYDEDGVKDTDHNLKVGFKFNRIGVYAVPVTLHSYNVTQTQDGSCDQYKVQMQISGNEDPQLFAIFDLDAPIVMSEGNITKYDVNFQIDFGDSNGAVVDSAAIYYNLYEDDAITWYKNQLIANASTAEAVTSLGVQLNYLRKQLNETVQGNNVLCGLGDDGDKYALTNHTHDYLKNLVDSTQPNGSVRGINTTVECSNANIAVYKSNGRFVEKVEEDGEAKYVYHDNPEEEAPLLVDMTNYYMGKNSLSLGNESITASDYAFNLSNKGILDGDSDYNILFGGISDTNQDQLNDHIAISSTKYSIIGAPGTTEIENMRGSLWMNAREEKTRFVDHDVFDSIGMGQVSVFHKDSTAPTGYQDCNSIVDEYNLLLGDMRLYAPLTKSLVMVSGSYGSPNDIGRINFTHSMNIDAIMSESESPYQIFDGVQYKAITTSLILGNAMMVDRGISSTIAIGNNSLITSGSTNSVLIGNNINTNPANREPAKVLTVEEFNAKYSGKHVEDGDTTFVHSSEPYQEAIVVGNGEISALNGDDTAFTYNVKGVALYISYGANNDQWICSHNTNSLLELDAYTPSGQNMKNMFMLGDNNSVGYNSCNSIIIGDEATNRRIIYKNSFISIADSTKPESAISGGSHDLAKPMGIFNNVWWIGHNYSDDSYFDDPELGLFDDSKCGDSCKYSDLGNFITNTWYCDANKPLMEINDIFAFVGRNNKQFAFAPWYGAEYACQSGWEDYTVDQIYQPCKAPMIHTGGIALGGYGTCNSNFMLLKIGVNGCWPTDSPIDTACMWTPPLNNVRDIIYLKNGRSTSKASKTVNANGTYDLYDDLRSDGIHHLQVDSPYAGMVLMVQDKQELDGTLHVGLGKVPTGGGGGTGHIIITDFDPSSGVTPDGADWVLNHEDWSSLYKDHRYIYQGWMNQGMDNLYTYRPSVNDFKTPTEDMQLEQTGGTCTLLWYNNWPGFNFEDGVTVLDWYFWYAIADYYYDDEDAEYQLQWMLNTRYYLNLNMNSLKEGVVYEVNLHVVHTCGPETHSVGSGDDALTYGYQASPVTKYYNGSALDSDAFMRDPYIEFISYDTKSYTGSCTLHFWGNPNTTSATSIKPVFYPVTEPDNGAVDSEFANHQVRDLARAKMLFTRIGSKVYVMEY